MVLHDKLVIDGVVYKETPTNAAFVNGQGIGVDKRSLPGRRVVLSTRRAATESHPAQYVRAVRSRNLAVEHDVSASPSSYRLRDHLQALEASMKVFHFQFDNVLSRAFAALTPVDGPATMWATPTWPIRPYGHEQGTPIEEDSWLLLVNRERVVDGFTVDCENGVVIFDPEKIPGPNSVVNLAYTCRMPVRVKRLESNLGDIPLAHIGLSYILEMCDDFTESPIKRYEDYSELEFLSGFVESSSMVTSEVFTPSANLNVPLTAESRAYTGDTVTMSMSLADAVALENESESVTSEVITLSIDVRLGVPLTSTSTMVTSESFILNGGFGRVDLE